MRNPARERSRNLNREVWESPSVYGGEDVNPLSGSWFGDADDFLSMDVKVTIRKLGTLPDFDPRE